MFQNQATTSLSSMIVFQMMAEWSVLNDVNTIYMQKFLNWAPDKVGKFMGLLGLSIVIGGAATPKLIEKLGPEGHMSVCNVATAMAHVGWGVAHQPHKSWLAILLLLPCHQRDA